MAELQIRAAGHSDIPAMAQLWQEKMTVLQQSDRRYRLAPDSLQRWSAALAPCLEDSQTAVFVSETAGTVVGYIIARCQASPAGL
jgi:hypothetical protein